MLIIVVFLSWEIRYQYDYDDYIESVKGVWNDE